MSKKLCDAFFFNRNQAIDSVGLFVEMNESNYS